MLCQFKPFTDAVILAISFGVILVSIMSKRKETLNRSLYIGIANAALALIILLANRLYCQPTVQLEDKWDQQPASVLEVE